MAATNKSKSKPDQSKESVLMMLKLGFVYLVLYALSLIVVDAWNLVTPEALAWRWAAAGMILAVNAGVYYVVRNNGTLKHQAVIVMFLVLAQIIFAGLNIYWERGMASPGTLLFVIPILLAASLKSRRALAIAAVASGIAYSSSAYRYFYDYYGEGYSVQLWGRIGFFSAIFLLIAWMMKILVGAGKK